MYRRRFKVLNIVLFPFKTNIWCLLSMFTMHSREKYNETRKQNENKFRWKPLYSLHYGMRGSLKTRCTVPLYCTVPYRCTIPYRCTVPYRTAVQYRIAEPYRTVVLPWISGFLTTFTLPLQNISELFKAVHVTLFTNYY